MTFNFSIKKCQKANVCLITGIAAFFLCSCHQADNSGGNDTSSNVDTSTASSTVATNQTDFGTDSATDSFTSGTESIDTATDSYTNGTESIDTATDSQSDTVSESVQPAPKMEIADATVASNCMPGVTGDKLLAFGTVHIFDANEDLAVFESATITVETTTDRIEQTIEVDVTEVPLSDGEGTAELRKTEGDPIPSDALLCVTLCKEATYTLNIVFSVGDTQISNEVSGKFICTS